MMTVRQLEKRWNAGESSGFARDLLAGRIEALPRLESGLGGRIPLAALLLIRLDELAQAHVPLYSTLVRTLVAAQEPDGGWRDPLVTALCLRALFCGNGQGLAIERGLRYLAQLQKSDGLWPREPLRRMPADAYVSAFILLQLGAIPRFRDAVRIEDVLQWFEAHADELDSESRRLWEHAALRCRPHRASAKVGHQYALSWS